MSTPVTTTSTIGDDLDFLSLAGKNKVTTESTDGIFIFTFYFLFNVCVYMYYF